MVNGAKGLDGRRRRRSRCERATDSGREVYVLPLPAVVGVKEGINLPRYPTMKGRLASKKIAVDDASTPSARRAGRRWSGCCRPPSRLAPRSSWATVRTPRRAVVDVLIEIGALRERRRASLGRSSSTTRGERSCLVFVEHDRGTVAPATLEALTFADARRRRCR